MRAFRLLLGVLCLAGCPRGDKPASPEAAFWSWFEQHEERLAKEARGEDPRGAMMEISGHLSAVNPEVLAELAIEEDATHPHKLVLTANGDTKQFASVKAIAGAAPTGLKRWKVVAFRQRRDPGESIQLGSYEAKADDFFFRETGRANGKVDVEVLVRGMSPTNEKDVQQAAFLMLDHYVGEYDVETKIAAISIVGLQDRPGAAVKPLSQLPELIDKL